MYVSTANKTYRISIALHCTHGGLMKKHATDTKKAEQYSIPTRKTSTLVHSSLFAPSTGDLRQRGMSSKTRARFVQRTRTESKQNRTVLQLIPHPNLPGVLRRQGTQHPPLVAIQTEASTAPFDLFHLVCSNIPPL